MILTNLYLQINTKVVSKINNCVNKKFQESNSTQNYVLQNLVVNELLMSISGAFLGMRTLVTTGFTPEDPLCSYSAVIYTFLGNNL